jgi:hypothetical protein
MPKHRKDSEGDSSDYGDDNPKKKKANKSSNKKKKITKVDENESN